MQIKFNKLIVLLFMMLLSMPVFSLEYTNYKNDTSTSSQNYKQNTYDKYNKSNYNDYYSNYDNYQQPQNITSMTNEDIYYNLQNEYNQNTPFFNKVLKEKNNKIKKEFLLINLSPTEKMFNKIDRKNDYLPEDLLLQQGYNFNENLKVNSSSTGKYGRDYRLSIGEKLDVYSYGDSVDVMSMSGNNILMPASKTEVSSNGSVYIAGIGVIRAENRTLGEVENEINNIAKNKYQNLTVKLTVSSGSEFSVFVYGEVVNPGKVYVGNNTSVLDALSLAGGVKKTGTLRNIKYNKSKIDLYKTLFEGNSGIIILKPNDVIFVDKIGAITAVKNGVQVPGIYEIKQGETINDVVRYAGGLLPAASEADITLTGFSVNTGQKIAKNISFANLKSTKLSSGDLIEFKELYNDVENTVSIQGNVKHPASFAYKKGMRLSDILKSEDELLEETFISQAVIKRISGKDNTVETIPVFLKEFFSGMNNPLLEPRDVITVYKNTQMEFIDVYGCIDNPKHIPYMENMTLKDILSDIKFMESNIQEKDTESDILNVNNTVVLTAETKNSNNIIPAENIAVEITDSLNNTRTFYLYDIMINSDKIRTVQIYPEDKILFRTLRNNEIIKNVKVSGFVVHPGVYSFVQGKKLKDMIETAGGLTSDADLRGLVFKRENIRGKQAELAKLNNERDEKLLFGRAASGYTEDADNQKNRLEMISQLKTEDYEIFDKYTGQIALNIKYNDVSKISNLDNIEIQDGDDIYVPRISNHISVLGEVYNEQSFVYKEGAKARYYIKEVGGFTPNSNKLRMYKIGINGRAEKIGKGASLQPGDTIVVPRKIAGNNWITPITQTLSSLANILVMVFTVSKL